jgi:hypothetical protein
MMDLDDQLEAMRAAWRAASVGDLSISQLQAQVRQEQRVLRREAWLEALASLAASAVFAVWAAHAVDVAQDIFVGLSVFAIGWPAITIQLRRKAWQMQAETVEAYRSFLQRRAQTGLFLARLGHAGGPLGLVIGLSLGRIGVPPNVGVQSHPAVIWMAAATLVVLWVWSIRAARRHKRALANLRAQNTIADAICKEF